VKAPSVLSKSSVSSFPELRYAEFKTP